MKDNVGFGEWNWELLANDWNEDQLDEWGLDIPELFEKQSRIDDQIPTITNSIIKEGDVISLNNHRILCGDITKESDIFLLLDGKKADLIFTDPPYDLEDTYTKLIIDAAKENCHVFIIDCDKNSVKRAHENDSFRKFFVLDFRIGRLVSNSQPMQRTTLIAEFLKGKGRFRNIFDGFSTLIESAVDHKPFENTDFNQAKKIELPEVFILHYSEPNDLVCDFFGGAGSTLIASEIHNRICFLMEIKPANCDIIIKRWINYMNEHNKLFEININGEKINPVIFV